MSNEKTNWDNLFERIDLIIEKVSCLETEISNDKRSKPEISKSNLMDLEGVSKYLLRTKNSIYKLVEEKKIPHYKKNNKLYFKMEEINEWIKSGKRMTEFEMTESAISKLQNRKKALKSYF